MLLDLWPLLHRRASGSTGYFPHARHELRARTRLRYTLRVTTSGAIEHHEAPVLVRTTMTTLAGAHSGSRHDHRLQRTGQGGMTLRNNNHVRLASTHFRIDDPDEWVIFGDPALS